MDKVFAAQIGKNVNDCVDDMAIKIHHEVALLRDIEETFRNLAQT